jgi:hypothetical protein
MAPAAETQVVGQGNMSATGKVELLGTWLYDGSVPSRVVIRSSDIAFGSGDHHDSDNLREDRQVSCFYVDWYDPTDSNRIGSEVGPFDTLREAITNVRTASQDTVVWTEAPAPTDKVGMAVHTLGLRPLNGLRHLPHRGTAGWYIWGGEELSQDPNFFQPVPFSHLPERCPEVVQYLALPPGSRFLIADGHEDVWHDPTIVHI